MYYTHNMKFTWFSKLAKPGLWLAVILLLLTMFMGVSINSAGRWLVIPLINMNFQTSDFAKIALIIYLSRMLAVNQAIIHDFKQGVLPLLIPTVIVCASILPENFSTAAMMFVISLGMMFFGRVKIKHILLIIGGAILAFLLLILIAKINPDILPRLQTWSNRFSNYNDVNPQEAWQMNNSLAAIYNGGLFGVGPGNGTLKLILSQVYADFFYAGLIEEFGIIGGILMVMVYLVLFYRTLRIASKSEKVFGTFMVTGIGLLLLTQAFVNMMVCTGLVPVTGQNMPMLSMGGTSTWFTCLSFGIILSVAKSVSDVEDVETEKKNNNTENEFKQNGEKYAVA